MEKIIVAEKTVESYLTKSKIGQFAINPYVGCPHACKYCYASFMKRFTGHSESWGDFIDIKRARHKINGSQITGKNVFMGTVTDCYNPYEVKYGITRSILEQLVGVDCYLQIATKNKLILRDLDLLKKMKRLSVALSVNTLDENFRRDMDRASTVRERLETLRTLHENGIYTILFMSPIFIGVTDWKAIIETSRSFVSEYWFEDLNLRGGYKNVIMQYVQGHYPDSYPLFKRIYVQGDKTPLTEMENEIIAYCRDNDILFSDYFHHEEVIRNPQNKILGKNHELT